MEEWERFAALHADDEEIDEGEDLLVLRLVTMRPAVERDEPARFAHELRRIKARGPMTAVEMEDAASAQEFARQFFGRERGEVLENRVDGQGGGESNA